MIRRLVDRLVVAWCRIGGSHFIEPWSWYILSGEPACGWSGHAGCEACTWCVGCSRLLGRAALEEAPDAG